LTAAGAARGGFRRDLARRLATAAVALPLILLALFKGPPWVMEALVALAVALGLWEFHQLLAARDIPPLRVAGGAATALLFMEALVPGRFGVPCLPVAAVVLLLASLGRAHDIPRSMTAAAGTLLGAVYLGSLGGTLAALRSVDLPRAGPWALMLLVAVIMSADSAAYFTGSALGRHKLAPAISPGKTWEGLGGGLVGGVAAALVVRHFGLPWMPMGHAAALGAAVSLLGTAGDLFESLLKRWAGVKDSGALFPGHGGMLDRLDSLLFGAPVLYYYLLYVR
jgi:phosphatidate cytidylyltransferase